MSTNFLQFNPGENNQETDTQYNADALRVGGVTVGAALPHGLLNKLWYQVSTMVTALAQICVNQGISAEDSNFDTLVTNLTNALSNRIISQNVTPVSVDAAVTTFQQLMSGPAIPAGALNILGKTIRISAHGTWTPASLGSGNGIQVAFNFGGAFSPNGIITDPEVSGAYDWSMEVIGVVTAIGTSGSLFCTVRWTAQLPGAVNSTTNQMAGANHAIFTLDLTSALSPSFAISFVGASAGNSGTQDLMITEKLN
jgi:hypothetical protein